MFQNQIGILNAHTWEQDFYNPPSHKWVERCDSVQCAQKKDVGVVKTESDRRPPFMRPCPDCGKPLIAQRLIKYFATKD